MIHVADLSVNLGSFRLDSVSLKLSSGEYGVLMGRTGSGKTTLLESICGLHPIEGGTINLAGEDVTAKRPAERGIGYVPQDGALFPRMDVRNHLAFPLVIRRCPESQIEKRVKELAAMLEISGLLDRFPARLSGGEIQRVALGRALSFRPRMLLLDEPLSALDENTRLLMYNVLKTAQKESGVTTLHVTHSYEEATHLADRFFSFTDGRVVETESASAQ